MLSSWLTKSCLVLVLCCLIPSSSCLEAEESQDYQDSDDETINRQYKSDIFDIEIDSGLQLLQKLIDNHHQLDASNKTAVLMRNMAGSNMATQCHAGEKHFEPQIIKDEQGMLVTFKVKDLDGKGISCSIMWNGKLRSFDVYGGDVPKAFGYYDIDSFAIFRNGIEYTDWRK